MKKAISFILLSLVLVSMIGVVSAESQTIIAGKIYNADFTQTVSGASVTVTCAGNPVGPITSLSDGAYSVTYDGSVCHEGSTLNVYAQKDGLYGSLSGEIHDNYPIQSWNLAIVNVPLVPEFGLIAGMTAILGAVGLFFYVRRK